MPTTSVLDRGTPLSAFGARHESYSERTQTSLQTILNELGSEHQRRLRRYNLYWDFYEGRHFSDAAFDHTRVVLNYFRKLIDIKANFLMKQGFVVEIPEIEDPNGEDDQLARAFVKNRLDENWRRNKRDAWAVKMAQMGGVTGDVWVRLSVDGIGHMEGPYVRADILPSNFVFPILDPQDETRPVEIRIIYPVLVNREVQRGLIRRRKSVERVEQVYQEIWTPTTITRMIDDEVIDEQPNPTSPEIPIVHVQNYPNSNSYYGISDSDDLLSPQRTINDKATDISNIIDYHGSPITLLSGAKITHVERGPDKIWALPEGAKAWNLEIEGDLKANLDYYRLIRQALLDLAGVPEQAVNPTTNVSNTPGVALHMTYLPLIENRQIKETQYGAGLEEINRFMIRYLELLDPEFGRQVRGLSQRTRYRTQITFGESLPRDEQLKIENNRSRLDMGITTRKRILMEGGLGSNDAERIVKEADEETQRLTELKALKKESGEKDTFGKGRRPDPVIQGDKISSQSIQGNK